MRQVGRERYNFGVCFLANDHLAAAKLPHRYQRSLELHEELLRDNPQSASSLSGGLSLPGLGMPVTFSCSSFLTDLKSLLAEMRLAMR